MEIPGHRNKSNWNAQNLFRLTLRDSFFSSVRAEAWKPLTRILVTRIFLISRLTRLSLLTYCFFKEKLCLLSFCGKISIALFRETRETMTTDRLNKINKKSFQCTLLCI